MGREMDISENYYLS